MDARSLKLTVRLCTDENERYFGPGVATLLEQVQTHHSLRAAAAAMGMAYSKAWRIIRTAETHCGFKLLSSTIGGTGGGGAVLTEDAERLLSAYRSLCAELEAYSQERFRVHFADFESPG